MLVHYIEPNGVFYFSKYRIYGINTGHDPTDIPFNMYLKFSNQYDYDQRHPLIDATYREDFLRKKFNKQVSEVAIKYGEIRLLPDKTLLRLINELELGDYRAKLDRKSYITLVQHALERISPPSYASKFCQFCGKEFLPFEEKQIFCRIKCAKNVAQRNYSKRVKALKTNIST